MKNTKKLHENNSVLKLCNFISALGAGFILSETDMAGVASFADISIAGALSLPMSTMVFAGSFVHCLIAHTVGKNIVKIIAMIIIIIAKMFKEPKNTPHINGIITATGIFVAGTAVSALIGEVPYKLLFYTFYGGLAGFTAYSLAFIIYGLKKRFVLDFSTTTGCAYAIVYTICIASLCSVNIPYINIGLILGVTVTLFGAYYYCHIGGVVCGALTACGAFLSSVDCGMTVVLLPASGLLTGYLNKQKNTTASFCFIGINFMLMVLTGITQDSIYSMIDVVFAVILFLIISPIYSDKWFTTGNDRISVLPEVINIRMIFLADTINTIRAESEKISHMLSGKKHDRDIKTEDIIGSVCIECPEKFNCWHNNSQNTKSGFMKLSEMVEFSEETFPYELIDCVYKKDLINIYKKITTEKKNERIASLYQSDNMTLLSEQMKAIEEILYSAGQRIDVRFSSPVSKMVKNKLNKFGFYPVQVISYYNEKNRLHTELYFNKKNTPENFTRICDLVSDELKIPFESSLPVNSGEQTRIRLFERPKYRFDVYSKSICSKNSDNENGDTFTLFNDGMGKLYVVLSDGMGNGKSAAVESRMVVNLFKKLVGSGIDYRSAIKLINSIMITKSTDETFATLDSVCINLDTCEFTAIKSGAAATLIRHKGNVIKIMSPTFPIGIYSKSEIFSYDCDFEENDIIIMFSDGINENEYRFIKELLLSSDDLKKIVDEIVAKANIFNPTLHIDDITVIGMRAVSFSFK